jgi:hypothetical protein
MEPGDRFRVRGGQPGGDTRAEIAAVRDKPRVAEACHQPMPELVRRYRGWSFARRIGEGKAGQRRHDDVVAGGRQTLGYRNHLGEGARPAVGQQDRHALTAAEAQEVHALTVDGRNTLGKRVEPSFALAPVVGRPCTNEPAHRRDIGACRPGRLRPRARPACRDEPPPKVGEFFLRDVYRELGDVHCRS